MKNTSSSVRRALAFTAFCALGFVVTNVTAHAQDALIQDTNVPAVAASSVVPETAFPTLLALDNNGVWALHISDGQLKIKGDVAIDSSNKSALWSSGGAVQISDGALKVAGGYTHLGNNSISPLPSLGGALVADPIPDFRISADLQLMSPQKLFLQTDPNDNDTELSPGVYNGGIFASGKGRIHLEPGVYVMNNGDFNAIGPTVEGEGVTIVMAGDQAGSLSFSLGAKLIASAPKTGQLKDLVIISRASGGLNKAVAFSVAGARLDGIVYAPNTQFNLASQADVRATKVICFSCSVVASKLELTGTRDPNNGDDAATATENAEMAPQQN